MKTSDSLASLAPALVKASAELKAVGKDRTNPHFKSTYASLDAIMEAVRPVLAKHGLTLVQGASMPHSDESGRLVGFTVETLLLHASGEFVSSAVVMPLGKADPQGAGAAMSYGRRYGVSAILSLATEDDDDGNSAMPTPQQRAQQVVQQAAPKPAAPRERGGEPSHVSEFVDAALERHNDSAPSCPKCGGAMWDNRAKKTNPKAPDFKCRDKANCDGVIWPPKGGKAAPPPQPVPADEFDVDAYAPDDAGLPF
jgi:hypothetical protein